MFDSLFFDQSPLDVLHLYSQMGIRLKVLSVDQIENVIISSVFFCLSLKFQVTSKLPKLSGANIRL
jgi:hypothetical protein